MSTTPAPPAGVSGLAADLHRYLQESRDGLLRALDGVGDYDARRPMTPTGTNLLGLVKHVLSVEQGYLVESVGRRGVLLPWNEDGSVWDGGDMWATAEESRDHLVDLYRQVWRHSDASLAELPLDTPAEVAWWVEGRRQTTFGHLVARVVAETARHAGHADILRENIDGQGGRDKGQQGDEQHWTDYVAAIQRAADAHRVDQP